MRLEKYKWRHSAFKGILSVIGLALFTAQLSYKFYFFANIPVVQSGHGGITGSANVKNCRDLPDYHNNARLLLDKRYDYRHTYALITPLFQVPSIREKRFRLVDILPAEVTSTTVLTAFFRGPPTIGIS